MRTLVELANLKLATQQRQKAAAEPPMPQAVTRDQGTYCLGDLVLRYGLALNK